MASPQESRQKIDRWGRSASPRSEGRLSFRSLMRPAAVLIWLAVVATLISVIGWFDPVPRPVLTVLSGRYDHPLLPDRDDAVAEADALTGMTTYLDARNSCSPDLTLEALRKEVEQLGEAIQTTRESSRPGDQVHLIYINLLGVALPGADGEPMAVLIPAGLAEEFSADSVPDVQFLSIDTLLETVATPPEKKGNGEPTKIIVFDCQLQHESLPLGVVSNQFFDAVQRSFESRLARLDKTFVLISCSAGEISWVNPRTRHTVYSEFFRHGLAGAAAGTDGRVSLAELHAYAAGGVGSWANKCRDDRQTPELLSSGGVNADEVLLVSIDDGSPLLTVNSVAQLASGEVLAETSLIKGTKSAGNETRSPTDNYFEQLQAAWLAYYQTAAIRPDARWSDPDRWRAVETSLMRSEFLFRHADLSGATSDLISAQETLKDVQRRHEGGVFSRLPAGVTAAATLNDNLPAFSFPMLALFGVDVSPRELTQNFGPTTPPDTGAAEGRPGSITKDDGAATSGSPEAAVESAVDDFDKSQPDDSDRPLTLAEVAALIDSVTEGASPLAAAELLTRRGGLLPAEAELMRMLTVSGLHPLEQQEIDLRQVLLIRRNAERAAVAVGPRSPALVIWTTEIQTNLEIRLRNLEDANLLSSSITRLGDVGRDAAISLLAEFEQLRLLTVRAAVVLQNLDQMHAELPYWFAIANSRRWPVSRMPEDGDLLYDLTTGTNDYLHRFLQLNERLQNISIRPPQTLDEFESQITSVEDESVGLKAVARNLSNRCLHEAALAEDQLKDNRTLSRNLWRTLDTLLCLPFDLTSNALPEQLALTRMTWLRGIVRPVEGENDVVTSDISARGQRQFADAQRAIHKLRGAVIRNWFALTRPDRAVSADWKTLDSTDYIVYAAFWDRFRRSRLCDGTLEQNRISQGAFNARLLPADLVKRTWSRELSPPQRLRRVQEANFLLRHAERCMENYWLGKPGQSMAWYQTAAESYINLARQLLNAEPDARRLLQPVEQRLGRLVSYQSKLALGTLFEVSRDLSLVGVDELAFDVKERLPADFPVGGIGFSAASSSEQVDVTELGLMRPSSTLNTPPEATETAEDPVVAAFQLARTTLAGIRAEVQVTMHFRGHRSIQRLTADAVSETDGPGWIWHRGPGKDPEIVVYRGGIDRQDIELLFLLDCSRSMYFDGRMESLQNTLLQFSNLAAQSGINVGIRVLGDQVVWDKDKPETETAARRDSRLLLPIQPFPGDKFEDAIRSLTPRGETPLFYSLVQAMQSDFTQVVKRPRSIVVISDGADNWASVGQRPDVRDLQDAYRTNGITINGIGFQTDATGFSQLEQIATVTGGEAVRVEDAEGLLRNVFGLAGLYSWSLTRRDSAGETATVHEGVLGYQPRPMVVDPGNYTITVKNSGGEVVTQRTGLAALPDQQHELILVGDTLSYPPPALLNDVGHLVSDDGRFLLRVMRAEQHEDRLRLQFSIQPVGDAAAALPPACSLEVRPSGADRSWIVSGLRPAVPAGTLNADHGVFPNVPGDHLPVWNLDLLNWPESTDTATFTVHAATSDPSIHSTPVKELPSTQFGASAAVIRAEYPASPRLLGGIVEATPGQALRVSWAGDDAGILGFNTRLTSIVRLSSADGAITTTILLPETRQRADHAVSHAEATSSGTVLSGAINLRLPATNR